MLVTYTSQTQKANVHFVYQAIGGTELKPQEELSGAPLASYADDLQTILTDNPQLKATIDGKEQTVYLAMADGVHGYFDNIDDTAAPDSNFGTDGQDIWLIYTTEAKGDTIETKALKPGEDPDHPNGAVQIIVHHGDGSPDTTTTVDNGKTPQVEPIKDTTTGKITSYNVYVLGDDGKTHETVAPSKSRKTVKAHTLKAMVPLLTVARRRLTSWFTRTAPMLEPSR